MVDAEEVGARLINAAQRYADSLRSREPMGSAPERHLWLELLSYVEMIGQRRKQSLARDGLKVLEV